jgi:hypothetical protein
MLAFGINFGKASIPTAPILIRTVTRHLGVKRAGMEHRPAGVSIRCYLRVWRLVDA